MQTEEDIKKRFNDISKGIGTDMAPSVVNASRVAHLQALNWVLGEPVDPVYLERMWRTLSGVTEETIP